MKNLKSLIGRWAGKKVFRFFAIYAGAGFVNQAIPFLLLPILTRALSPSDYGILATFMSLMAVFNIVSYMGTVDAIIRAYFDKDQGELNFGKFIFNSIAINLLVCLLMCLFFLFFGGYISLKLSIPVVWLFSLPIAGLGFAIFSIPYKLYQMRQQPMRYSVMSIALTVIEISRAIVFVGWRKLGWEGRGLSIVLTKVLFLAVGVYIIFRSFPLEFHLSSKYIKKILAYGGPVVIHSLGFPLVAAIDKIMVNRMLGLKVTGLYSVGYSLAAIMGFFVAAFNSAWVPILYEKLGKKSLELKKKLVKLSYIYFLGISLFALCLSALSRIFAPFFVGKEFYGSIQFILWISLGYAFHGMYTMVVNYIFYEKKTYLLSVTAVITVVLAVVFNYVLIKMNGAIGAAQAEFLIFLSRFLLIWYFSNKVFPMPWFSFAVKQRVD